MFNWQLTLFVRQQEKKVSKEVLLILRMAVLWVFRVPALKRHHKGGV